MNLMAIISILFSLSHAQEVQIEKIKEENKPSSVGCFDLTKMNKEQVQDSILIFDQLKNEFKSHPLTEDEKRKGVELNLKAVGVNGDDLLIVFEKSPAFLTKPGFALRKERRSLIEKKLENWKAQSPKAKGRKLAIHFDDECKVPHRCNDYFFDHDLKSKLKRFGCK